MDEIKTIDILFERGKIEYQKGNFFDAHEIWEDLWSDYYLKDRKFIQGLIQLSVSFVHLKNSNMKGAKSLLKKSQGKFMEFEGVHRSINIDRLKKDLVELESEYELIENIENFNWSLVPEL
ncbi:MAG: hypothetical protein CMG44_00850 [Candidatus Marinimicrobia bacterium]|nr:hypothetical protein [Candidatus Neomarinimicrobiota bacterium]